jgi:hypothetical protein
VHKQAEIPLVIQRAADPSIEEASGKAPDETPDAIEIQDEPEDSPKPPVLVFGENDEQYLSSTPSMKQKELLDLFQGEELHQVVKKLFANDEPSFRAAITEISLMHSWDHAAVFLDTLYLANNVDPFGTEAVLFTDTLFEHFHSPDSKK